MRKYKNITKENCKYFGEIMEVIRLNNINDEYILKILKDSDKKFDSKTSFTLVNGIVDQYFYKKLNMNKINSVYNGDYIDLVINYYNKIKKYVNFNEMVGIIKNNDDIITISNKISDEKFLANGNSFKFAEIRNLYLKILNYINILENTGQNELGLETAIWNFTIDGIFFDYDPPRLNINNSLFTRKGDDDHFNRTFYRNFDYEGMRTNLLATLFIGNGTNYNISDLHSDYHSLLIFDLLDSIEDKRSKMELENKLFNMCDYSFNKHPISIIKKELLKVK